jgi:putative ABC transport system permease protein
MTFLSSLHVALAALLTHKGRSALTSLGIVIGIGAVIAMVSAGAGARTLLDERLSSVGKDLILVRPGGRTGQGMVADVSPLTVADADAIRQQAGPLLSGVAPSQLAIRLVATPTAHAVTTLNGCTPDLQVVRAWKTDLGRFLSADDVKKRAAVCVLGHSLRDKLFPRRDPVGQAVRVEHLELRVVGVAEAKGHSPTGADQDDQLFVPLTTLQTKVVGDDRLSVILAAARSEELIGRARDQIVRVLRERHRVKAAGEENFDVSSVQEMASLAVVTTTTLQVLIAVIASISLVVGGIGIMNIMLVSVTERTREIGIRMAIGATPADVLTQFLIESVVLALAGGVLGVTLGLAVAVLLAHLVGWPVVFSPLAVLVAFGVSGAVGVFFGYYPAWKASRLDPIEALRHE